MALITLNKVVQEGGQITITGLPLQPGQKVRVTVETDPAKAPAEYPTVQDWLDSGLIGLWKDRTDIEDSTEFVNRIREKLQEPRSFDDDPDGQ